MDTHFRMSLKQKTALIAALSLLVTGILLGYSAFGWFSMSKTVNAVGQNLTITAPSNLEISLTGEEGTWSSSVKVDLEKYVEKLLEETTPTFTAGTSSFYLMPASSYNGTEGTMWQTGKTSGQIATSSNSIAAANLSSATSVKWREYDKMFAGYYIDVPLYFRAYNVAGNLVLATDSDIVATNTDITGRSSVAETVRVAFLNFNKGDAADVNNKTTPSYATASNALVYAVEGTDAKRSDGTMAVVSGTDATSLALVDPVYINDDGTAAVLTFEATEAPSMTVDKALCVRIWVEGQDSRCVADIGSKIFSVTLAFAIQE